MLPRALQTDEDLVEAFRQYSQSSPGTYFQLLIGRAPEIIPPATTFSELSKYTKNMPNPAYTTHYTMVSFYSFQIISNPDETMRHLYEVWTPFKALGRVYVAEEGINAQMAIPSNVMSHFASMCAELPLLKGVTLNRDPVQLSSDEYHQRQPFRALHIRQRTQIVVDGFHEPLDWSDAGTELAADEWDRAINDPKALVFDCRNGYESDIGIFDNAVPLNTVRFQDSWDVLRTALEGKDKSTTYASIKPCMHYYCLLSTVYYWLIYVYCLIDTPVVTYCTGGIR
jgi:predicted sulfurtransferase